MRVYQQWLYEKLCQLNPHIRTGIFLLIAGIWIGTSGLLLQWLIVLILPVIKTILAFIAVGIMWLLWAVVSILLILYLSLLFQGK